MENGLIQRKEDRRDVNWIALIRLADGTDHPCSVRDVSPSGLKICIAASVILPEGFLVKVVGRQLIFRVHQAWRRQHLCGVVIEKVAKLQNTTIIDEATLSSQVTTQRPMQMTDAEPTEASVRYTRLSSRFGSRLSSRRRFEEAS